MTSMCIYLYIYEYVEREFRIGTSRRGKKVLNSSRDKNAGRVPQWGGRGKSLAYYVTPGLSYNSGGSSRKKGRINKRDGKKEQYSLGSGNTRRWTVWRDHNLRGKQRKSPQTDPPEVIRLDRTILKMRPCHLRG